MRETFPIARDHSHAGGLRTSSSIGISIAILALHAYRPMYWVRVGRGRVRGSRGWMSVGGVGRLVSDYLPSLDACPDSRSGLNQHGQ